MIIYYVYQLFKGDGHTLLYTRSVLLSFCNKTFRGTFWMGVVAIVSFLRAFCDKLARAITCISFYLESILLLHERRLYLSLPLFLRSPCQPLKPSWKKNLSERFLKTRFSRCMLYYRHNAEIGTDWNLVFMDNSYQLDEKGVYWPNCPQPTN